MTHWASRGNVTNAAADVEMTSYVLLATLHGLDQSRASTVLPIVRWLSAQRNGYGGFSSTQVTRIHVLTCAERLLGNFRWLT